VANNKLKSKSRPLTKEEKAIKNKIRRGDLPKYHFVKEVDENGKEKLSYPLRLTSTFITLTK